MTTKFLLLVAVILLLLLTIPKWLLIGLGIILGLLLSTQARKLWKS